MSSESRCFDVRLCVLIVKTSWSLFKPHDGAFLNILFDWDIKEECQSKIGRDVRKGKRFFISTRKHQNVNYFDKAIWCLSVGCDAIVKKLQLCAENEAKCVWSFIETNGTLHSMLMRNFVICDARENMLTRERNEKQNCILQPTLQFPLNCFMLKMINFAIWSSRDECFSSKIINLHSC